MERIKSVLENMDVTYKVTPKDNSDQWYGCVEFWTDTADQDIPMEFEFDGTAESFVKEFTRCAENYEVDDEVELYVGMRGQRGVPDRAMDIVADCQEAKDTLMEIAEALQTVITDGDERYFNVPVTWQMCGYVRIKATSMEDAMERFDPDNQELPKGEYVNGSFELSATDVGSM